MDSSILIRNKNAVADGTSMHGRILDARDIIYLSLLDAIGRNGFDLVKGFGLG